MAGMFGKKRGSTNYKKKRVLPDWVKVQGEPLETPMKRIRLEYDTLLSTGSDEDQFKHSSLEGAMSVMTKTD